MKKTLTYDNGKEMSEHEQFSKNTKIKGNLGFLDLIFWVSLSHALPLTCKTAGVPLVLRYTAML